MRADHVDRLPVVPVASRARQLLAQPALADGSILAYKLAYNPGCT